MEDTNVKVSIEAHIEDFKKIIDSIHLELAGTKKIKFLKPLHPELYKSKSENAINYKGYTFPIPEAEFYINNIV